MSRLNTHLLQSGLLLFGGKAAERAVIKKVRSKHTVVNNSREAAARALRRKAEVSPRQQRKQQKLLRAIRRGDPTFAGHPIRVAMESERGPNVAVMVTQIPDGTYVVHYDGETP